MMPAAMLAIGVDDSALVNVVGHATPRIGGMALTSNGSCKRRQLTTMTFSEAEPEGPGRGPALRQQSKKAYLGCADYRFRSTWLYLEIFSSSMPFVRGPINPIASITISIAHAMNTNTPVVPNRFNTAAIRKAVKMAENRLHE
jgi:hypothetical protein